MEHSDEEEDNGSTILIESDEDLYDSDVTEISDDDEQNETRNPSLPALPTMPGQRSQSGQHSQPGQGSQSDSESLLRLPPGATGNQIDPEPAGLIQPRQSSIAIADIPGPSGLQTFRTSQSGGPAHHSAVGSQSAASSSQYTNEANTASQSQGGLDPEAHRHLERATTPIDPISASHHSLGDNVTLSASANQIEGANDIPGSSANRIEGVNDMQEGTTNQDEAMETEDDCSNDSMADFQETKKPTVSCDKGKGSSSSDDDESQSCIICYEPWTTSGSHRLVSLRCGHLFGQSCIEQWLKGQGGKCPQCNTKAKKTDVRVIYAKALKVLDTSERDRALKDLEREKDLRKKAEMDAAQTQLKYVMALEEVKRMKAVLESHQRSAAQNPLSSLASGSNQPSLDIASGKYILDRTIQVSPNGNCRVLAFDPANQVLVASMQSSNALFQGYGLKKISAMDFKTCQYVPIHSKPIRGLAFNERNDGLILSASVDKMLKITSLASNTVVQSYTCAMPAWCCAWNTSNINYVYAGLQNGSVVIYDTRKTDSEVQTLTKEGSRCPIVSLKYVPSKAGDALPCGGLLMGTLEGASFWEELSCEDYRMHKLHLEGSCTGVAFEPHTRHCLASFRPTKSHPAARYVMCEMKRQQVGDHGNSLVSCNSVQTFYGGPTMKLLTQSALFPVPQDDNKLIACAGDEATQSVYTWDASTGNVTQKIPVGSTTLDICPFNIGEKSYLGALTDKQIKLCCWEQR